MDDSAVVIRHDREAVERRLDELLPPESEPPVSLHGAMRYAVLGGGKRLRALLVLGAHRLFGDPCPAAALDAACAIEMLHAYTLVHDDLPALDDDDLRRGKPTCHRRYGEAVALLAGDALQAEAFAVLARVGAPPEAALECVSILALAAGSRYLVGGQTADMEWEGENATAERVQFIHLRKTAALISASLAIGSVLASAPPESKREIDSIGRDVGIAFQIVDDLLDVVGSEGEVGKGLRKDEKRGKITHPAAFGLASSREEAQRLVGGAIERIQSLGDTGYLGRLFALVSERAS